VSSPVPPLYIIANPANTPPTIPPTTPGPFTTAAPVLCAGAVADELLDTDDVLEEADVVRDTLEECEDIDVLEDMVALRLALALAVIVPLRLADADTDADRVIAAPVEERMSVGNSVGMTRALEPKKGAVSGSKRGPVSVRAS
jgi:hypothetical protein